MIKYALLENSFREKMGINKTVRKVSSFGKRMAKARKQCGLTQEELGKKVGISQRMVAYYENETKYPPAGKLDKIAKALKVSTDELLGLKPLNNNAPENKRLAKKLRLLEKLPKQDQSSVIHYIDALLIKRKIS